MHTISGAIVTLGTSTSRLCKTRENCATRAEIPERRARIGTTTRVEECQNLHQGSPDKMLEFGRSPLIFNFSFFSYRFGLEVLGLIDAA
jgi:hypothetical protein